MNNFFVTLQQRELLAVKGEDSGKFLQGQLTCDVEALSIGGHCLGASCNNKGRVLSSFRLFRAEEGFYLEMAPGLLSATRQNLDTFIVFYKQARTEDASSLFYRLGAVGPDVKAVLSEIWPRLPEGPGLSVCHQGSHLLTLSAPDAAVPRFELWLAAKRATAMLAEISEALPEREAEAWELLDMRAGIYYLQADDIGLFTPQVLNYDLNGTINFRKGCYTGQEIVARMHYRSTAKKRLYHLNLSSSLDMSNKAFVTLIARDSGQELGNTLSLLKNDANDYEALAILNTEVFNERQALMLRGDPGASITLTALD
ncbi:MAG: folate-binding protein [Pseudomonadales bacterium]|nr:folate-binding protein [Pseudomonadales bacterium]